MPDWGLGRYELIAAELEPAAQRVVAMANPLRGERVLDIACGTGNAAILAARFRASVTGIDLAPRLVEVARQRAADEGLDATFKVGDAQHLPFPDHSFDVVLSIFGLIFAPDREGAFSELVRVLRPTGRALFTTWLPGGAIDRMMGIFGKAMAEATGESPPQPAFEWHDADAVRALAGRHGVEVAFHDSQLQFKGPSPDEYFDRNTLNHPMSLSMRPVLEAAGLFEDTSEEALQVLREGNEDPQAFQVTSRYRVVQIRPRG
ncbi:MAG TPA: class I SAM-dependent methyltransferase [Actinomycetota bacterium]|nr:class I SAM-dependent methyltransferase [Actinomycetota bacterium]